MLLNRKDIFEIGEVGSTPIHAYWTLVELIEPIKLMLPAAMNVKNGSFLQTILFEISFGGKSSICGHVITVVLRLFL